MESMVLITSLIVLLEYNLPSTYGNPLPDNEGRDILTDVELEAKHDAMQNPGLYGGDMRGYDPNEVGINNQASGTAWPGGVVPYVIHSSLSSQRSKLTRGMEEFQKKTCIKFRPKTSSDRAYIQLQNGAGCDSYVGRVGGKQDVNLNIQGCLSHSTIVHELGHAIGFLHTHQRQDRDNFIKVNFENIANEYRDQWDKERGRNLVPYDTTSVMHYDSYAASKNGKPTMVTKSGGIIKDPPGLSSNDVKAIKLLYKC